MSDLLRLLFLVPIAYVAAVLAAAFTVMAGWIGFDVAPEFAGFLIGPAIWMIGAVGAAAFLPATLAIVAAELFRWRSVFFYLAVGGAIGLLAHEFAGFTGAPEDFAQRRLLFPAAGFVGAFVYWLLAGRLAGGNRQPPQSASVPDTRS